jgi:integrase
MRNTSNATTGAAAARAAVAGAGRPRRAKPRAQQRNSPKRARKKRGVDVLRKLADKADKAAQRMPGGLRGDPLAQISWLAAKATEAGNVMRAKGPNQPVANKTNGDIFNGAKRFISVWVRAQGIRLNDYRDFSRKHLIAGLREMEEIGYADGYIANVLSNLRRLYNGIGKLGVVPEGKELEALMIANGLEPVGRSYVATFYKGPRALGIDEDSLIAEITEYDPVVGLGFELFRDFGLRLQEMIGLQPVVCWKPQGEVLSVFRNTKGGKHREVPLFNDPVRRARQINLMERAIKMAGERGSPKGELLRGLSLGQAVERVRYVARKFGVTKTGLGIVPHSFRHGFACDLFTDRCGLAAPVLGTVPAATYEEKREAVDAARLVVTRALGHERMSITGAYTGSVARRTAEDKRLEKTLDALKQAAPSFAGAQVSEAWVVGQHALGTDPRTAGPLLVHVHTCAADPVAAAAQLGAALSTHMGMKVIVIPDTAHPSGPPEPVEITFQEQLSRRLQ